MTKYSTYIGMDLGDKMNAYCVMNSELARVLDRGSVRCRAKELQEFFEARGAEALLAIEAGTHSPWISRLAKQCGLAVVVANPREVKSICKSNRKNDKRDAEMLARLARADVNLLCPIEHRGRQAQQDLALLRARHAVVGSRTKLINCVRGLLKSNGLRASKCSSESFHIKAQQAIPDELRDALEPLLESIGALTARIKEYDARIAQVARERYEAETELLQTIPGVGPLTAMAYVLTLEAPERFERSRSVGAYIGLVPKSDQSGESDKQLRITKAGNMYLRQLLVSAAHYILGPLNRVDSALRQWGLRLAERGGKNAKKRAVVAIARKLSVLMHRLWTTGECYRPFPNGHPEAIGN